VHDHVHLLRHFYTRDYKLPRPIPGAVIHCPRVKSPQTFSLTQYFSSTHF
jgi:hypothetical protein